MERASNSVEGEAPGTHPGTSGAPGAPRGAAAGGRDLRPAAHLWARSLVPSVPVVAVTVGAMLLALAPLYVWAANAALLLGFSDAERTTSRHLIELFVVILVPFAMVMALLTATLVGAVATVAARISQGLPARPIGAFRASFRRSPRLLVVLTASLGAIFAAFVLTPFLVALGLLALVLTPLVRALQRRWSRVPWPATRTLVVIAVPFGLAAALVVRLALVLPVVALERTSIRSAFARSVELTRPQVSRVAIVALAYFLAPLVVIGVVNAHVLDGATSFVGPQLWSTITGLLLLTLSVAAVTYLFTQLGEPADLAFVETPPPGRTRSTGVLLVVALLAGAVPVGLAWSRPAPAEAAGATLVVNDLGDAPDADPGQGGCATEAGTCTLRAALDEANQSSGQVIGFAASGTITVGSTLRIGAPVVIDGSGRQVTVSGGGAVSVTTVGIEVPGGAATIRALTIADGYDDVTGGGAIFNSGATGGLLLDGVTVRDNVAAPGAIFGGAVVNASKMTVRNSTFSGNQAGDGTDGGDLASTSFGATTIEQSTFVGSSGASAIVSRGDDPIAITNSVISSGGGYACTGRFTGSGNVSTDALETCPGTHVAAPSALGLAPIADNGGPTSTVRLVPSSPAVDAGDASACTATDQRGAPRPKGAGCDAGAYELDPATATSLTATPDSVNAGGNVTLDARVTATGEEVVPTGKVELFDGSTSLGLVPLGSTGDASLDVSTLGAGSHDLTAVYRPDSKLAASTSPVRVVTVQRAASTVTLTSTGSPTGGGESVTFFIAVSSATGTTPTGSVTLRDGTAALRIETLDGTGHAQITTSALAGGPHVMVADYAGDAGHAPASSPALAHEVVSGTSVVLTAPPAATVYGNDAVFGVEVTPVPGGRTPTGLVTLTSNATTVGFADLDGAGKATIPVTVLPPGTNSVIASYAGDGYNGASSSAPVSHLVTAADTTVSFDVSPSPSNAYGAALHFALAVDAPSSAADPSGTVTIYDGTAAVLTVGLNADGTYSSTLPLLPAGSYSLRAEYSGATGFRPATSQTIAHQVTPAATTVALSAGSGSSVTGEQVSLTATVTNTSSAQVPMGSVTFRDGATVLGSAAVDASGVARLDTRAIAVGSRTLTATFAGSADFAGATSPGLAHAVQPAAVAVAVASSPTRSWYGSAVAIDVVVTAAAPGSGTPTGAVTIRDGAAVLGTATLDGSGHASLTVSTIAVGDRTISAAYASDGRFQAGTGSASQTVDPDSTTVTVSSSEPDQLYGRPVTLTAAVTGTGSIQPSGTVTFTAGRTLGTATLDATGRATITVPDLEVGTYLVQASYAGDGSFTAGTGQAVQRVSAGPTATALAVSPASPTAGQPVTLTATVTAPGAALTPSGTVGFYDNDVLIGTATLDPTAKATFATSFDRSTHELQARFTASTSWQASTSTRQTVTPGQVTASLSMGATPNPAMVGHPVTFVAALTAAPGAPAPTGVIHFTDASGAVGSAAIVDGVATLTATAPATPGAWIVSGWYPGDVQYGSIAPTPVTVVVGAAPTSTTVVSAPNPGYALDGAVTVRAHVTSTEGAGPIAGTVRFTSDSPVLTSQTATVDSAGFAEITITDVPAGSWHVRGEYLPASGSPYAGSSGSVVQVAVKRPAAVKVDRVEGLKAGRATTVTASVTDPSASGHAPTGTIVIDGGDGATCTTTAPGGSCTIVLPVGPTAITATYSGDGRFLGDDDTYLATVTASTPALRASSPTRTWVTGDPIAIDWSLPASASGTVTVRSPFGVACTVPAASSGSCTATIPFPERGASFDFDVAYSGDATWDAAHGTVSGTLRGCYPVPFTASPPEGGTVAGPPGNCNDGAGFVEGTKVTALAAPAPGYVLSRWLETGSTVLASTFAVGEDARSATALFELDCVTVTTRAGQAPGVDPLGSASGRVELSPPGDCGVADRVDPLTGATTSRHRRGTTIQATAVSSTPDTGQFKGWTVNEATGASSRPTEATIDVELTGDVELTADFGARCYRPDLVAKGDGSARFATAPNCFDGAGSGYVFGTQVAIDATPGAFHYVGPMATSAGAFVDPAAYGVRSDDPVLVAFDPCLHLTTDVSGSGRGTVQASTPSTCPAGEAGWYVPGEITLTATPSPGYSGKLGLPVEGDRFKRWDDADTPIYDRSNPLRLDLTRDRTITAVFTSPSRCANVDLVTQNPDWLGGLAVSQGGGLECDSPDQYVQGQPFTLTAVASQGSPLIQWKATGLADYPSAALSGKTTKISERTAYRSHVPGGTATMPALYGDVTATAYACAAISSEASIVDADGNDTGAEPPDGFVSFDRAPSCPGTGNGWLVGDTVGYYAGAQPLGYEFQRWDGDVAGTEQEGSLVLDGSRPVTTLRSVYQVHCYTLAVTPEANTARGVEPNCPGADPSEGRYVGGTTIALHAFDGGQVWVGWEGDVARPEDPSWIVIEKDSTAHAKWRAKTTNEKVEDFFTDVADVLAVGAKKLVGVAIVAATALVDSALTAAMGLISLAATAIDAIAGALGSPSDSGFREAMVGIQQTASLFSAPFSCGAEWAFADASTTSDGNTLVGTGGDLKDVIKDPKKLNDKINDYGSSLGKLDDEIAALEDGASTAWLKAKKFKVKASTLKSAGGTALTLGGAALTVATTDFGVEGTASEAWGSESGRAFMSCMEEALPDYWNVPPLGYSDG